MVYCVDRRKNNTAIGVGVDIFNILGHNTFRNWLLVIDYSTTEQTGDFSVKIIAQYARKDKVSLFLTPNEEEEFNPALLCALRKAINTHHKVTPLRIEGKNGSVVMHYRRPAEKPPDTLAAFGRLFLHHHTHITSCDTCKKRNGSCDMVRACESAQQ